ncbi:tetraacyldisaccharide 4'-kinase [Helicobacter aurati]|nr:tetraacyldisaccharide 4'-kinase [Helicobacter aurati]
MAFQQNFIERYFFSPTLFDKIISFLLLPFSFLYYVLAITRKKYGKKKDFHIKIISIGNLVSGGSGKTPFCIAILHFLHAHGYMNLGVVLRGYKRKTRGLLQVSMRGNILCDVLQSGDEAMLIALQTQKLQTSVFVSETREDAIVYAKKLGIEIIVLDDSYRFTFKKFDVLLEPELCPFFERVLPSGYYRFPPSFYAQCDMHLKEGKDYIRKMSLCQFPRRLVDAQSSVKQNSSLQCKPNRYVLATAIANPSRLDIVSSLIVPHVIVYRYSLPDHGVFDESLLECLLQTYNADCILMTQKDFVKCQSFTLPIHVIDLRIEIMQQKLQKILEYLTH